jgi:hypothetical protein
MNIVVLSVSSPISCSVQHFASRMDDLIAGKVPFTLRIEDPMANSWIYSPTAPEPDPRLRHEQYDRTEEQNLDLGLLDMKTEGYGEEEAGASPATTVAPLAAGSATDAATQRAGAASVAVAGGGSASSAAI